MDDFVRSLHGYPAMAIGLTLGALFYIFVINRNRRDD